MGRTHLVKRCETSRKAVQHFAGIKMAAAAAIKDTAPAEITAPEPKALPAPKAGSKLPVALLFPGQGSQYATGPSESTTSVKDC